MFSEGVEISERLSVVLHHSVVLLFRDRAVDRYFRTLEHVLKIGVRASGVANSAGCIEFQELSEVDINAEIPVDFVEFLPNMIVAVVS